MTNKTMINENEMVKFLNEQNETENTNFENYVKNTILHEFGSLDTIAMDLSGIVDLVETENDYEYNLNYYYEKAEKLIKANNWKEGCCF